MSANRLWRLLLLPGALWLILWGSLAFWAPRAAEELNSSTFELSNQLAPFPLDGAAGIVTTSGRALPAPS